MSSESNTLTDISEKTVHSLIALKSDLLDYQSDAKLGKLFESDSNYFFFDS
jgi:hypothetical protein